MTPPKTIGLLRMRKEAGEKRVFLPEFAQYLTTLGATVFVEEGYGSRSGYTFDDYRQGNEAVRMGSREEIAEQEVVLVLRSPNLDEFDDFPPRTILISMLHYPTRPKRVKILSEKRIRGISLDSIVDDNNVRLVENMRAVAWNGLEAAYNVLEKLWSGLRRPDDEPIRALILGTGMVGKHAVAATVKLGNVIRNNEHITAGGPGAVALSVGRNLSYQAERMQKLFSQVDILVDATQRRDPSSPVVPNEWIAWLPDHAVIVDLAVDPYTLDVDPPVVRGVEGIPQGNLDHYVFAPEDPSWSETVPASVPTQHRRTTVSCYSWPGIHPEACMRLYAQQIEPMMKVLFEKGYEQLSPEGDYFERALYRATLKAWQAIGVHEPRPR